VNGVRFPTLLVLALLLLMPAEIPADTPLPPLHTLEPAALDSLLAGLAARCPTFADRLRALALARVGAPYALGTLGEEKAPDPDPLFRVDEADCTVLVLTTAALAHARNTAEARAWMGPLNYRRRGDAFPVRYENRVHFTEDRITATPLFSDLTPAVATPAERKTVHLVLNRSAAGQELLPLGWERAMSLEYVPAARLGAVLSRVPAVAGIAFVREANVKRGLFVAHEGFLLDRRTLLHASQDVGRVATVDVLDYLLRPADPDPAKRGRPRFDGVLIYGFIEGAPDLVAGGAAP
jgi:hypothetical protein